VLLTGSAYLGYQQLVAERELPLRQKSANALEQVSQTIYSALATLQRDALYLSHNEDVRALSPDSEGLLQRQKERVRDLFSSFSIAYLHYAQMRWIDAAGMELVRCEQKDRLVFCLGDEELQDKSDRYYFQRGMEVAAGRTYLSRLDLNVEHWAIEVPYVPTIRAAAPVINAAGKRTGLVVVNFNARTMLNDIMAAGRTFDAQMMLVNGRGQWLIGERPGDSWAHLLGASGNTFSTRYPNVWDALANGEDEDWVSGASGVWKAQRFDLGDFQEGGESLVAITHIPMADLARIKNIALIQVGVVYAVALGIGFWLAWLLASLTERRRLAVAEAEERGAQLGEANKLLTQTLYNLQVMQDDLVRAERLSSLGMMVAGIAEQLSGPLGITTSTLENLKGRLASFKDILRDRGPDSAVSFLDSEKLLQGEKGASRVAVLEMLTHFQNGLTSASENAKKAADLIAAFKQLAAEREECERRTFTMQDLLRDVLGALSQHMQKRHVVVELKCPENIALDSYPGPLAQATENLLRNVCDHAYGPAGGPVYISVRQRQGVMVMVIEDTGRGIPEDERRTLFGPFFTSKKASGGRKGGSGSGMGLYLTYRFVTETLDGKLSLKSVLGLGSRFTLEIPMQAPAERWDIEGNAEKANGPAIGDAAPPSSGDPEAK
jgi:signal transduction histidine kinase